MDATWCSVGNMKINIIPLLLQLLESLHAGTFFIGLVYGTCSTGQHSVEHCSCEHGTVWMNINHHPSAGNQWRLHIFSHQAFGHFVQNFLEACCTPRWHLRISTGFRGALFSGPIFIPTIGGERMHVLWISLKITGKFWDRSKKGWNFFALCMRQSCLAELTL